MSLMWNGKKYEDWRSSPVEHWPGTNRTEYSDLITRADDYEREQRLQRLSDSQPLPLGARIRWMLAALLLTVGLWALIAWGFVAAYRAIRSLWG